MGLIFSALLILHGIYPSLISLMAVFVLPSLPINLLILIRPGVYVKHQLVRLYVLASICVSVVGLALFFLWPVLAP